MTPPQETLMSNPPTNPTEVDYFTEGYTSEDSPFCMILDRRPPHGKWFVQLSRENRAKAIRIGIEKLSRLSPGSYVELPTKERCEVRASSIPGAPDFVRMVGAACLPMVDALPLLRCAVEAGGRVVLAGEEA